VQADEPTDTPLGPFGYRRRLRDQRDRRKTAMARREGVLRKEPEQLGEPVGYYVFFRDPDGNTLELSTASALAGSPA
jgi:catechol 2,3-dioxygenase-like lactoylglutathione lyase family enzyme